MKDDERKGELGGRVFEEENVAIWEEAANEARPALFCLRFRHLYSFTATTLDLILLAISRDSEGIGPKVKRG